MWRILSRHPRFTFLVKNEVDDVGYLVDDESHGTEQELQDHVHVLPSTHRWFLLSLTLALNQMVFRSEVLWNIETLPLIICYHACPCGMQPYGVHYATMHKCRKALAGTRHCYYLLGLFTNYIRKFSIILFPLDTVTLSQPIGAIICFSTNLLSLPTSYVNVLQA